MMLYLNLNWPKGWGGLFLISMFGITLRAKQALLKTEHLSKHAVVGCESCGQCRLGETLYICPETCPKRFGQWALWWNQLRPL